jgi:DNA-binding response OmpR family regulator
VSNNRVLIAEDDVELRAMLATVLELQGKQVILAADGAEAFALACQHRPGVILLDLMMPRMSGEEFRGAQLSTPEIKDIPVVVISARHDVAAVAGRMRAAAYFAKPVDIDALVNAMNAPPP